MAKLIDLKRNNQFELVISAVVLAFGHSRTSIIRKTSRGDQSIVTARQVAIYLCRTVFGMTYSHIGSLFLRDRTTISHSCQVVEVMRDDLGLDRRLSKLEDILRSDLFFQQTVEDAAHDFTA